jgi:hypothetical protein
MLIARKSHYENNDSLNSTASSRAVSRALYSDQNRLDMTLDDGIRSFINVYCQSFINVLRLQGPKSGSKITKNTQNTRWPFLAPPDHANARMVFKVTAGKPHDLVFKLESPLFNPPPTFLRK